MREYRVRRLASADEAIAQRTFLMMAAVFGEDGQPLTDKYLQDLLSRDGFWVLAAFDGAAIVGGLTAHTLPMTRSASTELFIYDLAVISSHRRAGVGRLLVQELRRAAGSAGIDDVFVAADDEDGHALDFYRAQGAVESAVTFFTFGPHDGSADDG